MALTPLQLNTVKEAANLLRFLQQEVKPRVDMFNIAYDSAGGVKETIGAGTEEGDGPGDLNLASEPSLSNLTKAELDDAMFAMTSTLKTALDNTESQMGKLASRGALPSVFNPWF